MTRRLTAGPPGSGGGGGGGTDLSPVVTISSRDELVSASITPGPNFTLSGKYMFPQIFPLNAGEDVTATETSFLGATLVGCGGFTGDTNSALLSGHIRANGLALTNVNTGPDAYHYGLSSVTRELQMYECRADGAAGSILVDGCIAAGVRGFIHLAGERGIVVDGVNTQVVIGNVAMLGQAAGWRGVEILDTATIALGLQIKNPSFGLIDATHRGIKIADLTTVSPGARVFVTGAANTGDLALLFDQEVGSMSLNDLRLIVDGSTSGNWSACAAVGRTDLANPVLIAYPPFPAAAPTPIPYKDGVNPAEVVELSTSVRWRLVKDVPNPGDWYMEFLGPKVGKLHRVAVDILVDRNAGTQPISLCLEKALAATPTTWAAIGSTVRSFDNTNAARFQNSSGGEDVFSEGDRVRPASENLSDAVAARVFDMAVTITSL